METTDGAQSNPFNLAHQGPVTAVISGEAGTSKCLWFPFQDWAGLLSIQAVFLVKSALKKTLWTYGE